MRGVWLCCIVRRRGKKWSMGWRQCRREPQLFVQPREFVIEIGEALHTGCRSNDRWPLLERNSRLDRRWAARSSSKLHNSMQK